MADDRLHLTGDADADRLLATDPMALLIGFALDQQVPVQKAFSGPRVLLERLGSIDARTLATVDDARLEAAAKGPPAIHRFPSAMGRRVKEVAAFIVERYEGDASRIWTDAADATDLKRRLGELPGFGPMKVASLFAVLIRRLGVDVPGAREALPTHPTLGDVDSPEALAEYQSRKRAAKAAARASSEA
jgi:uncharacterized HhH-GPD family protein